MIWVKRISLNVVVKSDWDMKGRKSTALSDNLVKNLAVMGIIE